MKLYHRVNTILFYIVTALFFVYSYVLVDPNITFVNNPIWAQIREQLVNFGYHQRNLSSSVFLILVFLLFWFHLFFIKEYKKINLKTLVFPLAFLGLVSYPFLSHDLFNYMFDAKILTFYHQNPYAHKALDFPQDPWLRFMHWTHRSYPYGPTFLLVSAIPSLLSFGKFLLGYLFFKATIVSFYVLSVYFLNKMNKKWAVFFATNPIVIVEGLINSHNDLIAVGIGIGGIYALSKGKKIWSLVLLLISGGVKFIHLPMVLLYRATKKINSIVAISFVMILFYVAFFEVIQPWYFLGLFILLPYFESIIFKLNILFAGLLLSYYPYIRYGDWGNPSSVKMKEFIILVFFLINAFYLLYCLRKKDGKKHLHSSQ